MDSGTELSFTASNKIPPQTIQIINSRLERQQLETLIVLCRKTPQFSTDSTSQLPVGGP